MQKNTEYNQLRRLVIIYDLLRKNDFTKRSDFEEVLIEKLDHFSSRTFDRDLSKLRDQFDLIINFEKHYGYYLDKAYIQDTAKIESLMHLVDSTVFKMSHLKKDGIVFPFTADNGIGNEYLYDINDAITKACKLRINYKSYWTQEKTEHVISPYLLKEYQLRWYVLSKVEGEITVFGLDRIKELDVLVDQKTELPKIGSEVFRNIIGVSEPHLQAEKVVLLFTPRQGRYINSSPLHHSQKVISENENGLMVQLKVGINWELKEEIKKQGVQVKVLEPLHLVEEIKQELLENIKQYQS